MNGEGLQVVINDIKALEVELTLGKDCIRDIIRNINTQLEAYKQSLINNEDIVRVVSCVKTIINELDLTYVDEANKPTLKKLRNLIENFLVESQRWYETYSKRELLTRTKRVTEEIETLLETHIFEDSNNEAFVMNNILRLDYLQRLLKSAREDMAEEEFEALYKESIDKLENYNPDLEQLNLVRTKLAEVYPDMVRAMEVV